jgi:CRISPR-associated protein Cas2
MAWVLVFFDLPVGTSDERKAATNFRKDLIQDGYMMVQFSVYARPCGTADRVETQVRRLKSKIPAKGEVRGLMISDAQWGRMIIMRSQQPAEQRKCPRKCNSSEKENGTDFRQCRSRPRILRVLIVLPRLLQCRRLVNIFEISPRR